MEESSQYLREEVQELQKTLAQIDLKTEHQKPNRNGLIELLLVKLKNIKIKMYQEQSHNLPHIHIDYINKNHCASYAIHNGERIKGNINNKYDKEISKWILKNQDNLQKIWKLLKNGNDPVIMIGELIE